jgi:hypothetical protein
MCDKSLERDYSRPAQARTLGRCLSLLPSPPRALLSFFLFAQLEGLFTQRFDELSANG